MKKNTKTVDNKQISKRLSGKERFGTTIWNMIFS